jgi:acetyl esterase/lipase
MKQIIKKSKIIFILLFILCCSSDDSSNENKRYLNEIFSDVEITSGITFGQSTTYDSQNMILTLDLYQPAGDNALERAAIVWIHGGHFTHGDKTDDAFVTLSTRFAKRGYVCVSINYRIVSDAEFGANPLPAMLNAMYDAKAAVRWLRKNAGQYRIDPERIAIGGGSAGGYTSLHVAYHENDEGTSGNPGYSSAVKCVADIWGGMASYTDMENGEPPLIIIHGTEDTVVPYTEAEKLVARAEAVGIPCELHTLVGTGHAAWQYIEDYITWIAPFFYKNLF